MFANLLNHRRRSSAQSELAFVRNVVVKRPIRRSRRSEALLIGGWLLIGLKCWATFAIVAHYRMPFNPWWIVLPTLAAAAACTWVYLRRN